MTQFPQEVIELALLPKPQIIARWAITAGVAESEESLALQSRKIVLAKIAVAYGAVGTVEELALKWDTVTLLALIAETLGAGNFNDLATLTSLDILSRIYEIVSGYSISKEELVFIAPMIIWAMVAYDASVYLAGYDDNTDSGYLLYDDGVDSGGLLVA